MAFSKKHITLVFTLSGSGGGQKTFADTNGANRVTVKGLRVSCKIVKAAAPAMNQCDLKIYGLTPTVYNALSSIYSTKDSPTNNTVTVMAGDDEDNLPVVFVGHITVAQINLNPPEAIMTIAALSAQYQALAPVSAVNFPGPFDVATAMKSIADTMGFNFENNGVNVQLKSMKLDRTTRDQAIKLAEAANIDIGFDDTTLVISPRGGNRSKNQKTVEISAQTGMIGYPGYGTNGIVLKTLFNPDVKWHAQILVKSGLQVANLNGLWKVYGLTHMLESESPTGRWDTEIQASNK